MSKSLLELDLGAVRLFTTHLASRHEETAYARAGEVRAVLEVLATAREPHALVGDFNALQPRDRLGRPPPGVEPRGDALPGAARTTLKPFHRAGYVDCFRTLHPTRPGHTYPAEAPWLRLDYVFASPELAARLSSCDVVATDDARAASDHLPVRAAFS